MKPTAEHSEDSIATEQLWTQCNFDLVVDALVGGSVGQTSDPLNINGLVNIDDITSPRTDDECWRRRRRRRKKKTRRRDSANDDDNDNMTLL